MAIEVVERARGRAKPTPEILPIGGINTDVPPTELRESESPDALNVIFHKFGARTRGGLSELGALTNITGIPVGIWEFVTLTQERYLLVLTTNGIFRYIPATETWEDLNGDALSISGNATDFASGAFFPLGGDSLFAMTNGIDPIIKYTGSGNVALLGGVASPEYKCKIIRNYMDFALLINITSDAGTAIPQRIMWSDIGDPEKYDDGLNGFHDIISNGTEIKAAEMLRGILYIYMENSIVAFNHVGGRSVFRWNITVPETGISGKRTVAEFGNFQIFLGDDNVYIFDGTQHLRPITEDRIGRGLIESINYDNADNAFSIVDKKYGLYSLLVPEGNEYWPLTRWTYDINADNWSKHKYANYAGILDEDGKAAGFLGGTLYRRFEGLRWSDLVGTWLDQEWRWSDRDVAKGAPRMALITSGDATANRTGSVAGGDVLVEDATAEDDNGTKIESYWHTKDFQIGDDTFYSQIEFEAIGDTVDIDYSTDEGATWTALETVTLSNTTYVRYTVDVNVLAERLRFRFRNNVSGEFFDLRKYRFWPIPRL